MGDVPRPHGLFSAALLGDAWPAESESALKDTAGGLKSRAERHADAASAAKANTDKVFSSDWTDGAGAEAAYAHYQSEHEAHHALQTALDSAGTGTARIADSVGSAKVKMRTAHDDAHREIEEALRATPAGGIVNVAPILAKYRGQIHSYATELHGIVGDELSLFSASHNVPPLAPSGTGSDGKGQSTDGSDSRKPDKSTSHAGKEDQSESGGSAAGDKGSPSQPGQGGSSRNPDQSTGSSNGAGNQAQPSAPPSSHAPDASSGSSVGDKAAASDLQSVATPAAASALGRAPDASSAAGAAKSTVPQMPSLPSTGGGASSSPLSGAASSGAEKLTRKITDGYTEFVKGFGAGGVAVVDPAALAAPSEAPPVVIEEVLADGQALEHAAGGQALTLPAGLRRLEVRYAALAFRSPEQAHFAGQLEGFDPAPVDLGHARSVTYTNLGPGFYRLALAAATEGGPLPPPGELLRFRLRPRFYQTPWFLGLAALSVLLAGLGFYRLRLAALTARYEAVLAERTRIARELHDTLAQDLTAALLHLRRTQAESGRGAPSLASALDSCRGLVEASLAAARRSVASLRQPLERQAGLHQSLEKLAEEARRTTSAEVVLEVATQAPSLAPEVEENLLAIAHEALVNAVRHAAAGRIRLVLGNGDQRLRLAVEDDGLGFEPAQAGENGHYGLLGMRERAAAIGAEVAIDSHTGAGTRVEITLARPRLWSRR